MIDKILKKLGNNYKIISYKDYKTPLIIEDLKGYKYKINEPRNILRFGIFKNSIIDKFKYISDEINTKYNEEYTLVSNNNFGKIKVSDKNGFEYITTYTSMVTEDKKPSISKCINKYELFVHKAKQTHGDIYEYPAQDYIKCKGGKMKIKCKIHGYFYQTASSHVAGNGCKFCSSYLTSSKTFTNRYEKCFLYFVELNINNGILKIGITTKNNIHERFKCEGLIESDVTILYKEQMDSNKAVEKETHVKNKFFNYSLKDDIILKNFKGKTECFDKKYKDEILSFLQINY